MYIPASTRKKCAVPQAKTWLRQSFCPDLRRLSPLPLCRDGFFSSVIAPKKHARKSKHTLRACLIGDAACSTILIYFSTAPKECTSQALVLPSVKQVSPAKRHAHGGMPSSDDLLFGLSLDSCLGSLFLFGFWPFSTLPKRFSRTFFNQLANYSQNPFILP